jgi:hypothetical protein
MIKNLFYEDPYSNEGCKASVVLIPLGTWFLGNIRGAAHNTIPARLFYKDHEHTLLGFDDKFNQICSKSMDQVVPLVENTWAVDIRIDVYPGSEAPYKLDSQVAFPGKDSQEGDVWYGKVANNFYKQRVFMLCDGRIKALDQHVHDKDLLTYGSSWGNACPFYWAFEAGIDVWVKRKPFEQKSTFKISTNTYLQAACDKLVANKQLDTHA